VLSTSAGVGWFCRMGVNGKHLTEPVAVLFQKLPTREERLSATGDNEVVRLPLSEEANDALRRQRTANTVPPNGAFDVVAHN